ncbi:class I adenylate-forming enzyme family protein [Shimia haliotis]|uniref:Acyl-CoA synthetase (AMP-forming)/AMP-acid ligase II n=1 Tax=Shimia haliotis TaxID=1280847 RepID=A0A1I4C1R6_9RHOB|nr:class I adenylate-forming enzyme family protein [Shimia haliotis]SFK75038.1 Acyl-CoA synthetase (AMP-forming)/AMP-acid ligase II [Shimia haliotis]
MQFENRNIGTIVREWAERAPDARSIEYQTEVFTRQDVQNSAAHLAQHFSQLGVQRSGSVALLVGNPVRGIESMLALWSLGAAVLFLDARQSDEEIDRAFQTNGISIGFSDLPRFQKTAQFEALPPRQDDIVKREMLIFADEAGELDALILSSSGTTSLPRYRRVSHQAFVQQLNVAANLIGNPVPYPSLVYGSPAFGAVIGNWVRLLMHGTFALSLPMFLKTAELDRALRRSDVLAAGLPPVLIRALIEFHKSESPLASTPAYANLKRLISVGGPISANDLQEAYALLSRGVRNIYSMTGVGAVSLLEGNDIPQRPNSVGKPLKGVKVRIVGASGETLPIGETGRIMARATWKSGADEIESGDIGRKDEQGFLYVVGRSEQIATRNSVNVNLIDLETDVKKIDGVRDCIAFSKASENTADDEIFLAVETSRPFTEMRNLVQRSAAVFRHPDYFLVSPLLPRNAANKLSLRALKDEVTQKETRFVAF